MYNPNYNLTPNIINNLTLIERFYGQLESLKLPKSLELNLERDNLVQSSYISNSIEGNPLSLPEVTNLLLDERVPVNRDEKEVKNYFDILKNLKQYSKKPINIELINRIHKELLNGVDDKIAGRIRNKKVIVGGYDENSNLEIKHEPPFHNKEAIENNLKILLKWLEEATDTQPIIKISVFHHQYVYLHPFIDGNGRTCRLLSSLLFQKYGYEINKYFVLDDYYDIDRLQYSDKLNSADKGDKTEWIEYFSDGVKYSLQSALSKTKNAIKTLDIELRPTKREKEVLDLFREIPQATSIDIAKTLKISRQQAHKLLSSLVEKGLLKKKGETKSSYYILK